MQTAARAASSTARSRSRSPNGSLPFVRANCASPTTVSWATIGTASVDCTRPPSSRGTVLRPGGAQGVRAGRVERVVVDGADRDGHAGAGEGRVGDGAGEGDAAQFRAAVGEPGRGLVAGQQALVEVDGGEVAEAGDDDVEEFAGRGLQVEGVADAGAGLVQQGEVAPGGGGLAGGGAAGGDVGSEPGDADGAARTAVHAVEVDGPVAALVGARHEAGDVHVRDGVAALQHAAQGRGDPVGLGARQVVVDALAAVVVGRAAEDGGEPRGWRGAPAGRGRSAGSRTEIDRISPARRRGRSRCCAGCGRRRRCRRRPSRPSSVRVGMTYTSARPSLAAVAPSAPSGIRKGTTPVHSRPSRISAILRWPRSRRSRVDERLDGVHADGAFGGDAEELLGAQAPLVDQPVGADGEGRDLDVVVDRAGRTALPHGVAGPHPVGRERTSHRGARPSAALPSRPPTGPRTPWPSLVSRSREPSPPAHRVRHRSPGAAARSIQHYGAAQHGVHDHSTVPMVFGPDRDNTSSLLTRGHVVESRRVDNRHWPEPVARQRRDVRTPIFTPAPRVRTTRSCPRPPGRVPQRREEEATSCSPRPLSSSGRATRSRGGSGQRVGDLHQEDAVQARRGGPGAPRWGPWRAAGSWSPAR